MTFNAESDFLKFKDEILNLIRGDNYQDDLVAWVQRHRASGYSKQQIYLILCKFLPFTAQIDDPGEQLYERMADFLDGFTYYGKSWRILPGEPDVE